MAHVNGIKSPSMRENNAIGKRKRAIGTEAAENEIQRSDEDGNSPETHVNSLQGLLEDILEILQSYDTSSILQQPIATCVEHVRTFKKPKLSESSITTTVTSMVDSEGYSNIHQFIKDVDLAVSGFVESSPPKDRSTEESHLGEGQDAGSIVRANSFKKRFDNIISREMVLRPTAFSTPKTEVENDTQEGLDAEQQPSATGPASSIASHRQVLTLFGSAPNARQLFSSFQQPNETRERIESKPLREWGLPNGISTTRIIPVHGSHAKGEKKVPTLGDLSPQPASLVQLNPPRQSKHAATRSASVSWVNATETSNPSRPYRRDSYATQALATGQWLKYNVPPSPSQLATPEAKRKQRDRALSFGEPQPTLPQETLDAHNQKKEDALFQSVYSSFAPSRDNTGATISQRTKERLWWDKYGEEKFESLWSAATTHEDEVNDTKDGEFVEIDAEDQGVDPFKEAVDTWKPEDNPVPVDEAKRTAIEPPESAQEVDEILKEISELLETLNSYQRVRNLSISNSARSTTGQSSTTSGTPTSPSSAEVDMYNILRSQLSIMISSLPPWAIARIDGEKLGNLNVSSRLQVEIEAVKGTVDEEELTTRAKTASTPASNYPRTINPPASVPARSTYAGAATQAYHRPSYAPQTVARPTANPSSYLPNQQYSARPPSASQYLGTSRPSYAPRPGTIATDRYNYTAGQQYNPQAQSTPSGYLNGNRSYPNQNASYYNTQYTASQSTPSHAQRPGQPGYQYRPVDAITYDYRASSGKSASPAQANTAYSPPQRSYAGMNATPNQPRPNLYQSNSSSYSQAPAAAVNGTGSYNAAYRSANEQAAFMNRQRTQLDEQQKTTPMRQTSGTPQPANGVTSAGHSRTGTPQQNGITTGQG